MSITKALIAVLVYTNMNYAIAEAVYGLPSPMSTLTLEQKSERSLRESAIVFVGKVKFPGSTPKLEIFSDDKEFILLDIEISKIITGKDRFNKKSLQLKLPILRQSSRSNSILTDFSGMVYKLSEIEHKLETKSLDEKIYLSQLKVLGDEFRNMDGYLRDYILIPIDVDGLDVSYRTTVVPVSYNKTYIFCIMKDRFDDGSAIFPWQLDVYIASDPLIDRLKKNQCGNHHSPRIYCYPGQATWNAVSPRRAQ